jgi:hypothetical protein
LIRLLLLLGIASALSAQKTPQLEDYPVTSIFTGTPAAPKFQTAGQRRFRTVIRDGAAKGPNFAGHYTIAQWGCGTGCVQMAVVDLQSGDVYEGPFGILPNSTICLGANAEEDKIGVVNRRDSSLLIVKGCPNEKNCGTYYYSWTGKQFKLIRKDPMKPPSGCEP